MGYLKDKEKNHYYDKKPTLGQKSSFNIRNHFKQGFTVFIIIAAAIVCYFVILRFSEILFLLPPYQSGDAAHQRPQG